MTRRVLVPDAEITRVMNLAQQHGLQIAGIDVGRDYVRLIPPTQGSDSVDQYFGTASNKKGAG